MTQKGTAMIGDLRTDALHEGLKEATIDDSTLLALLVLAFGGRNVSVHSGAADVGAWDREEISHTLTDGGVLTADQDTIRGAVRSMLTIALSCRDNMSNSGVVARIAGDTIGAARHLPNMATEEFLSCLSKTAIGKAATAEGVRVEVRGKDTRTRLIERFKDSVYVYPAALFKLTPEEVSDMAEARHSGPRGWDGADTNPEDGIGETANADEPAGSEGDDTVDGDPMTDGEPADPAVAIAAE